MRKILTVLIISCLCILILGCESQEKPETKERQLSEEDLYDIYFIKEAPKSAKKQNLSDVIKIVFTRNNSSQSDTIAIDLERNIIHKDPWMSSLGINSLGESKHIEDINEVLNILEKYNVQDWKEDYTYEDPLSYEDGYGWSLRLQFVDGIVGTHKGSGSFAEEITPDNFTEYFHGLNDFVNERLEEDGE